MDKEMSKKDYIMFLEDSVCEDAEAIDIPSAYKGGLQSPITNWDGNSSLPAISKEEDLDEVINKILKKTPDAKGTNDPNRDEGSARIAEVGNLANDAQAEVEGGEIQDEKDAEGDVDCPDCDKKIAEIYQELGISPLALLEEDEGEEEEEEEEEEGEDDSKKPFPGAAAPFTKKDSDEVTKEGFTSQETRVLEQLIKEMGLVEEGEGDTADALSDEPEEEAEVGEGDDLNIETEEDKD